MSELQELVIAIDTITNLFTFFILLLFVFLIIYAFCDHAIYKEIRKLRKLLEKKEEGEGK